MHMKKLLVQGYKCYGPGSTSWELGQGSYVLVGPANAGKSALAGAVSHITGRGLQRQDFYGMGVGAVVQIKASLEFAQSESIRIAQTLLGGQDVNWERLPKDTWIWLATSLFTELDYVYTARLNPDGGISSQTTVQNKVISLQENTNLADVMPAGRNGTQVDSRQILEIAKKAYPGSVWPKPDLLIEHFNAQGIVRIVTSTGAKSVSDSVLNDGMRTLVEVRSRPVGEGEDAVETWEGSALAGVLGKMSSGNKQSRARYRLIKEAFEALYPPLKLYPWRPNNKWVLGFEVPSIEEPVPATAVGMGTVEGLLLLTNLITSEQRLLVLEEPELHLHPPVQRSLLPILKESAKKNQLIVVTHSPQFVDLGESFKLVRLSPEHRPSEIEAESKPVLGSIQPSWLREYLKDALFAKAVLLVEGPYDQPTCENLLDALCPSWRALGVVVVPVDGKKSVSNPYNYLTQKGLAVFVCFDNDAIEVLDSKWEGPPMSAPISSALEQAARAGIILENQLTEILTHAATAIPSEKPNAPPHYPSTSVGPWRNTLATKGWFVLSDELPALVLKAAGLKAARGRLAAREVESVSRNLTKDKIPKELTKMLDTVLKAAGAGITSP